MNGLIGTEIRLHFEGEIRCINCERKTRKSFAQGHCFPCMRKLASCDTCIVRPERCHYAAGTCREPSWGEQFCLIPHTVYLSNTGAVKVGITRGGNESIRWVDQGASQALPIRHVSERLHSGMVEIELAEHVADKTNWRKMLSGVPDSIDLEVQRDQLFDMVDGDLPGTPVEDAQPVSIHYPVLEYPQKVKSLDLEKLECIEATLMGIKGQYLILDQGVINMRKYTGYECTLFER